MVCSPMPSVPIVELNSLLQPTWTIDDERLYVTGFMPAGSEQIATCTNLVLDADQWGLSFCRDFRALHQFNHDHDCTGT